MPRAGLLRHRLAIGGVVMVDDGRGGEASSTFENATTVWGSLEGMSGTEQIEGGQSNARALYRSRIRYRDDINPQQTVTIGERSFNVLSAVDPTGRRKELELLLEEQP